MQCREAQQLLSAASDGELDEAAESAVKAHLATCGECQKFAADVSRITGTLAGWTAPEPRPGFTRRVMPRLPETRAGQPWFREWIESLRPLTAAAAMIALCCGAALAFAMGTESDASQTSDESTTETFYGQSFGLVPGDSVGGAYFSWLQEEE